tara:strand:- start:54 stop:500 length:447 start_codon:yes stop_codon:yes gene_type:complete
MSNDILNTYEKLDSQSMNLAEEYLKISDSTMDSAITRHTSVYAFFGSVMAYAKKILDSHDLQLDNMEAQLRENQREELTNMGKKATDRALDGYVKTVPEVQEMKQNVVSAQYKYNLARNIVNSLDHQKDMLVQMSANKRAEIKLHELN